MNELGEEEPKQLYMSKCQDLVFLLSIHDEHLMWILLDSVSICRNDRGDVEEDAGS